MPRKRSEFAPDYPPGHANYEGPVDPELAAKRAHGEQVYLKARVEFAAEQAEDAAEEAAEQRRRPGGRPRGVPLPESHRAAIQQAYVAKRSDYVAKRADEVEQFRDELRQGLILAAMSSALDTIAEVLRSDSAALDRWQDEMLSMLRKLRISNPEPFRGPLASSRKRQDEIARHERRRGHFITRPHEDPEQEEEGDAMRDAASVPYVSPTQTRHEPMTGVHTHDHAAYSHASHDDGIHEHEHEHHNDADHDHMHTGKLSGTGMVGRLMQGGIGPAERSRLKNEMLRQLDENR
jgi:hypothetical protein